MNEQIEESRVHTAKFQAALATAAQVKTALEKARKRFAALAKVEERHANHYQAQPDKVAAQAA